MQDISQSSVSIRQATPDDALDIANLKVTCWRDTYDGLIPSATLEGLDANAEAPHWRDWLVDTQSGLIACVAEKDGVPIAYALAGAMRFGDRVGQEIDAEGEIYALYIHPDHQRGGLGHQLVAWLLERLIGAGYKTLGVWMYGGNVRAENFYSKLGAVEAQKRVEIHNGRIAFREKGWLWTDLKQLHARLTLKSV